MTGGWRGDATSIGLLILRIGAGGLLLGSHGWSKLTHFGERLHTFANPIGLGPPASFTLVTFAEVVCAALVVVGFLTRFATVPIIIFLMVAAFIQHAHDPWPRRELPLLFMTAFLCVLVAGPGRFSIDALIGARRGRRPPP